MSGSNTEQPRPSRKRTHSTNAKFVNHQKFQFIEEVWVPVHGPRKSWIQSYYAFICANIVEMDGRHGLAKMFQKHFKKLYGDVTNKYLWQYLKSLNQNEWDVHNDIVLAVVTSFAEHTAHSHALVSIDR